MTIHSNPYAVIHFESDWQGLSMIWNKESSVLDEQGIKSEILKIVEFVAQYEARNVIVDSRNYVFRDNQSIQTWINRTYIPMIVESGVLKYAIIVNLDLIDQLKSSEDDVDDDEAVFPVVHYFTDLPEAKKWINS